MPNKAIFIGLGGSGVTTAGHLKANLLFEAYNGNSGQLEQDCRFIFIDTDDAAVNDINKTYLERLGGDALIESKERIDLGDVNPRAIYVDAIQNPTKEGYQHLLSWVSKAFNQHGVEKGVQVALQRSHPPSERELLDLFTQTLLYREMFEVAKKQQTVLVDALIHLDTRFKGEQQTLCSTLYLSCMKQTLGGITRMADTSLLRKHRSKNCSFSLSFI